MRIAKNSCRPRLLRLGIGILAVTLWASAARAELPALLREAFVNSETDDGHWAYTETQDITITSKKKSETRRTIVRFDPSKPYAEQYVPQLVEGHAPTSKDLKKYRKQGEDRGDQLAKQEKEEATRAAGKDADKDKLDAELRKYLDVDRITVSSESDADIVYVLPVRKGAKAGPLKLDRVDLVVRVSKQEKFVTEATARLHDSMRVMLIANLKSGGLTMTFARVDPKYGPVPTSFTIDADVSVMFMQGTTHAVLGYTDFVHVTPYGERFQSSIGPLKVLGF